MKTTGWLGMGWGALLLAVLASGCRHDASEGGKAGDVGATRAPAAPLEPPAAAAPTAAAAEPAPADRANAKGAKRAGGGPHAAEQPAPDDRPGLGTEWGESRSSHISTVPFTRADDKAPIFVSSLFYNDEQGAKAMASSAGFRRNASGPIHVGDGAFDVGLRDDRGHFLSGFTAGGKEFVIGEAGQRYTVVLKNQTDARFEAVVSVDGLDVMDGKPASFSKRGYIVDPHEEVEVDGFRQSVDQVAAFRFGSVRGSYANQKHGDTRNVGVIGVALFHERGANPATWLNGDAKRRREANPFPGKFASPP